MASGAAYIATTKLPKMNTYELDEEFLPDSVAERVAARRGDKKASARALLARVASIQQRLAILKQAQPEHNRKVEDFAALLLSLWSQLQSHSLTTAAYLSAVGAAYDDAVGDVPDAAISTLDRLRQTALDRASSAAETARLPDDHEDAPSEAQRGSMAHGVAGALWAGLLATAAYRTAAENGEDAVDIWEWQSQDDPATCPDCEDLDGKQFSLDEIEWWPGESDFGGQTQCGPNCLLGDALVSSPPIRVGYRRWYDGPIINVSTATGHELTGTPNHPVLTLRGWQPIGLLKPGDKLIACDLKQNVIGEPNVEHVPSVMSEVYESFAMLGLVERIVGFRNQFHADGRDGQVDVVRTNGELRNWSKASGDHPLFKFHLPDANHLSEQLFSFGTSSELVSSMTHASDGGMCCIGQAHPFIGGGMRHSERLRLMGSSVLDSGSLNSASNSYTGDAQSLAGLQDRLARDMTFSESATFVGSQVNVATVSRRNANRVQLLENPTLTNVESFSDGLSTLQGLVHIDEIVSVDWRQFTGHVYNLETATGWYIADGYIVQNCRCELTATANDRTNAPVQSVAKPPVVKDAKCPVCGRWLGRNVNVGATLHCPKHNEVTIGSVCS